MHPKVTENPEFYGESDGKSDQVKIFKNPGRMPKRDAAKRRTSPKRAGITSSRPRHAPAPASALAQVAEAHEHLASQMPSNATKPNEFGYEHAVHPVAGQAVPMPSVQAAASTLSESNGTGKTGAAAIEPASIDGGLDRVRVNAADQPLTTNQGVPVSDNQNSLKAGLRGPTLLEDFILREKITHFDHERIPERIVHARGSAAHGYFECYKAADQTSPGRPVRRRRASARRCSSASRRWPASAARPIRRATCAASP